MKKSRRSLFANPLTAIRLFANADDEEYRVMKERKSWLEVNGGSCRPAVGRQQ